MIKKPTINNNYYFLDAGIIYQVKCTKQVKQATTTTDDKGRTRTTKPTWFFDVLGSTKNKDMTAFESGDLDFFFETIEEAKQRLEQAYKSKLEAVKNLQIKNY